MSMLIGRSVKGQPSPVAVEVAGALRDLAKGAEQNPGRPISGVFAFEDWVNGGDFPAELRAAADAVSPPPKPLLRIGSWLTVWPKR